MAIIKRFRQEFSARRADARKMLKACYLMMLSPKNIAKIDSVPDTINPCCDCILKVMRQACSARHQLEEYQPYRYHGDRYSAAAQTANSRK